MENPQQRSIHNLQEPVAVLAFLRSPHLNAGMKQYECVLLYINELPLCTKLLALLFADDTTLLAYGPNLPDLIQLVNDELFKIATYFRVQGCE